MNQFYCIQLEDYSFPRTGSYLRNYCGTKSEILELMSRLSANPHTALRYAETIEAVDLHDLNPDTVHHVAGQELRVLEPVHVIDKVEFTMENFFWTHFGIKNEKIPATANKLDVAQILVQANDRLIRFARFRFEGLAIWNPATGWSRPCSNTHGFPGMVNYTEPNIHDTLLFAGIETYDNHEIVKAIKNLYALSGHDCAILCDDILGEV